MDTPSQPGQETRYQQAPPTTDGPMAETRPTGVERPRADPAKRVVAGLIDAVIAVVVGFIPVVGGIVASAYWLLRDGLDIEFMDHRSIGKKLLKLRPVRDDGGPMDLEASARRNWPLAVGGVAQVLMFIPFIGWLLVIPVALVALGLAIVELVLVLTDAEGRRIGDKTGGTRVIEVDE